MVRSNVTQPQSVGVRNGVRAVVVVAALVAAAQALGVFSISTLVAGAGGGSNVGGSFSISSTIGQPTVSASSGVTFGV